jgi:hypothetical protein
MNCVDFERTWNELLDARGVASPEVERALETHTAGCASCRSISLKYQTLRHAIQAWDTPPAPSAGFVSRVLEAHQASAAGRPRGTLTFPWIVRFAAAAAALLGGVSIIRLPFTKQTQHNSAPAVVAAQENRPLSAALADATSATLDLAREASAPAARIGREVIAEAAVPEQGRLILPVSIAPATDVLQSVGNGVNRGVRPLSGTARQAFGFLMGPASSDKPAPRRPREA